MSENKKVRYTIRIEDAQLIFKNFSGREKDYNEKGNRNFGVILPEDVIDVEQLKADGWNIKYLRPREDDPEQYMRPWLSVKVKYNVIPPIVTLITSRGKRRLTEDTIDQLDWSRIENVDLIISPYNYPAMRGREAGVSAYLKSMYVTLAEDEFDTKYADIPDLDMEESY